jgi:hypothetical protein
MVSNLRIQGLIAGTKCQGLRFRVSGYRVWGFRCQA